MSIDVSIVIPIYNAESIMADSVDYLTKHLDSLDLRYEILLRDDESLDKSREVLEKVGRQYDCVRWFTNPYNKGLGFTLRELFKDAEGDHIIYCDCDLPFGAKGISLLLDAIKRDDIVVASRYSGIRNYVSLERKVVSRLYFLLCKLLFNIPVVDIGSGMVALRKEAVNQLDLNTQGFGIHAEIFVKASQYNFSIKEIPAESRRMTKGSFSIWRHGWQILNETFALWLKKL